jgi:hypothetical protein
LANWIDLEKLFGAHGACGGCWCMWWRLKRSVFPAGQISTSPSIELERFVPERRHVGVLNLCRDSNPLTGEIVGGPHQRTFQSSRMPSHIHK